MTSSCDALVVGAGGFLGGHLVRSLLLQGLSVRAVDVRPVETWFRLHPQADNRTADLSVVENAIAATSGATTVYDLAAAPHDARRVDRMTGVLTDTHLLLAARDTGVDRFVVASSAVDVPAALDATSPDDRCWRHLFTERMARHFLEDFGLQTRVARLGPVYGADGGRGTDLPVVTTVTRSVALAVATHRRHVDIPFRADDVASHVYVDDAVLGLQLIAHGTDECGPHVVVDPAPTTVARVVDAVVAASGAGIEIRHLGSTPTPRVVGDTRELVRSVDWQPDIALSATLDAFWAATSTEVRRRLDLPPSLTERSTRRRASLSAAQIPMGHNPSGQIPMGQSPSGRSPRPSAHVVGRHRYENAG